MIKLLNLSEVDWKPVSNIDPCLNRLIAASHNDSNQICFQTELCWGWGSFRWWSPTWLEGQRPDAFTIKARGQPSPAWRCEDPEIVNSSQGSVFFHHKHIITLMSDISVLLLLVLAVESYMGQPNITLQECVSSASIWVSNASSVWEVGGGRWGVARWGGVAAENKRNAACQHKFLTSSGKLLCFSRQKVCAANCW